MSATERESAESIRSTQQLDEILSRPTEAVVETMRRMQGDIIVLGAGGKMGPTLTMMAKRASDKAGVDRRIFAVDLFPSQKQADLLEGAGIRTIKCNMLDPAQLQSLPDADNVVFMAGMKFGSTGQEALTWAINTHLPGMVAQRYVSSRIAVFSSGNIYGLSPVTLGGSTETDPPNPVGDYASSALGRERIFQYFSEAHQTPTVIIRLNYAVECRYGVLFDVARKVFNGEPVDVTMGNANVIWQGDANAAVLQSLEYASAPALILNLTGPELISIRRVAEQFGEMMQKPVVITGREAGDAILNNAQKAHQLLGYPTVCVRQMMTWIAEWIMSGGETLGKPTHFEGRDGKF